MSTVPSAFIEFLVDGKSLIGYKKRLAAISPYFHRMFYGGFSESSKTQIVISDVDYESFENFLNFIDGDDYVADPALLSLVRKYDVKIMDEHKLHKMINVTPDVLQQYIEVMLLEYPDLPQKVIDIIASKVHKDADLSWLDSAILERIIWSKKYLYFNKMNNHYIDEILLTPKTEKKSLFRFTFGIVEDQCVRACSPGYALLKLRGYYRSQHYSAYQEARAVYTNRYVDPVKWSTYVEENLYVSIEDIVSVTFTPPDRSESDIIEQFASELPYDIVWDDETVKLSDILESVELPDYNFHLVPTHCFTFKPVTVTAVVPVPPLVRPVVHLLRPVVHLPQGWILPQQIVSDDEDSSDED
jgi:hypothetical protein